MMRFFYALLLLWASPAFADNAKCDLGQHDIGIDFNPRDAILVCQTAPPEKCKTTVELLKKASLALQSQLKASCDAQNQITSSIADVAGQTDAMQQTSNILGGGIASYKAYIALLEKEYNQIAETLSPTNGPLGSSPQKSTLASATPGQIERQQIRNALSSADTVKSFNPRSAANASDVTGSDNQVDQGLFAGRNGVSYLKKILIEKDKAEKYVADLSEEKGGVDANIAKAAQIKDPTNRPDKTPPASDGGGGLDLKSVAGLATAGAGLAGLMQKQDAAASSNDTASATSPTPNATNPDAAQGPASSQFGSDKAQSQAPVIGQATPKKDPASPGGTRTPSGSAYSPYSDISKAFGGALGSGASSPATSKPGGGGGSAGTTGNNPLSSDAEAAAAAKGGPNPPAPDDTQGLGGGALGGGGPPSLGGSAPSMPGADAAAAPPPGGPEDSMKDLLHEMKETAEGTAGLQAGAADILMSDEDLFPRVRAAYVRVQKQGRVLDGLGEKITEENQ